MELERSPGKPAELKAWDRIYEEARQCKGELILVTVGPETNLALAFRKYPDLPEMIKRIVVMGGSLDRGNVTEYAEANIWHDAEAARIVFGSGIPIDMVGLNVTRQAPLGKDVFDGLERINTGIREVMEKLIEFRNGEAMHDAIAISSLVDEDVIKWQDAYTQVIDGDGPKRGMTVTEYDRKPNSRVAVGNDTERYYRVMRDMMKSFR